MNQELRLMLLDLTFDIDRALMHEQYDEPLPDVCPQLLIKENGRLLQLSYSEYLRRSGNEDYLEILQEFKDAIEIFRAPKRALSSISSTQILCLHLLSNSSVINK